MTQPIIYPTTGTIRNSLVDMVNRLYSLTWPDGDQMFNSCGVWNDQCNRMASGKGMSFQTPACFVEVQDLSDGRGQYGIAYQDLRVTFHIVHEQLDGGNMQLGIAKDTFDMDLKVMDLRTQVRKSFTGANPAQCSSFIFDSEKPDYKHTNLYHFMTSFRTKYTDNSGNPYLNGQYTLILGGTWTADIADNLVPELPTGGIGTMIVGKTFQIS